MQRTEREDLPFFWRLHPKFLGFNSGTNHTLPVNSYLVEVTGFCSSQPETGTAKGHEVLAAESGLGLDCREVRSFLV